MEQENIIGGPEKYFDELEFQKADPKSRNVVFGFVKNVKKFLKLSVRRVQLKLQQLYK